MMMMIQIFVFEDKIIQIRWYYDLNLLDEFCSTKEKYSNGKIPEMVSSDLFVMYKVAINAEKNYFKNRQLEEFSNVNKVFMEEGIKFYKQLTEKLEAVHSNCWPQWMTHVYCHKLFIVIFIIPRDIYGQVCSVLRRQKTYIFRWETQPKPTHMC